MGVRGFDLGDRGGRSEPTSPDRRERAGTTNTCQQQQHGNRCVRNLRSSLAPSMPLARTVRHREWLTYRQGHGAGKDT